MRAEDIKATKKFHITNTLICIIGELSIYEVPQGFVERWTKKLMHELSHIEEMAANDELRSVGIEYDQ